MARRKVTMLEAFQRSAVESAERAAAERRRVIAEREKEIRRSETAKAAQEFSSRISQAAGDSVGSLIAGLRGGAADVAEPAEKQSAEKQPAEVADTAAEISAKTAVEMAGMKAHAPDIASVPPVDPEAVDPEADEPAPMRSGPALPSFDRAVQPDLPDASTKAPAASTQVVSEPVPGPAEEPAGDPAEDPAQAALEDEPEEPAFADASQAEVEEAIAALESDVLELPMSPKVFAVLGLIAALAIFMIGYSMGHRDQPGAEAQNDSGFLRAGYGDLETPSPRGAGGPDAPGRLSYDSASVGASGAAATGRGPRAALATGDTLQPARRSTPEPTSEPAGQQLTVEDQAFRSAEMKFSIMAITYTRTEAHAKLAMETYDLLYDEGFPVIHPISKGSRIFVFVGASKTKEELKGLTQELKELRTDSKRKLRPFRSAYLVNIDSYR
jgi:hypothetical protein